MPDGRTLVIAGTVLSASMPIPFVWQFTGKMAPKQEYAGSDTRSI